MRLVEQHIIKKNNKIYFELSRIAFLSKNLYNAGLYAVRQHYFESKEFLNYYGLNNKFVKENNIDYYALPAKVSQQTLKMVDQNFKSFFGSIKAKQNNRVSIPKYLDKNGKYVTTYTIQAISKKLLKDGYIKLSGTDVKIKTDKKNIHQVRIVPGLNCLKIDIIYEHKENKLMKDNMRYCAVDPGLNNLATVGSNVIAPIIINGRPLKSINHYYNKKLALMMSKLRCKCKTSNKIKKLVDKRNRKVKDYMHKASRMVINHLVSNQIGTLVIGHNKEWKQEINIGRVNNQNFVQIPHSTFFLMLRYKAEMEGINVIEHEESYTSKCSFLDDESVGKHDSYAGRRRHRGLFVSFTKKMINADLNGSLNILRKAVPNVRYDNGIEAIVVSPLVITIK